MSLSRIFGFVLSMVMVVTLFSSVSSAQFPRPLRWLGQGYSDGYHQCNPGPNSDYYNPYSAHNSYLVSRQPGMDNPSQHGSIYQSYAPQGNADMGVPFSVYAAPPQGNNSNVDSFKLLPGKAIDNSFVPYDPDDNSAPPVDFSEPTIDEQESPSDQDLEIQDDSAYAPNLRGHVEFGSQVRTRQINNPGSNGVSFSKSSFQTQPVGTIVDERIEDSSSLFDPFANQ